MRVDFPSFWRYLKTKKLEAFFLLSRMQPLQKKKTKKKTANVAVKLQRAPPRMRHVAPRPQQLSLWLNVFLSRRVEDTELFSVCALI